MEKKASILRAEINKLHNSEECKGLREGMKADRVRC